MVNVNFNKQLQASVKDGVMMRSELKQLEDIARKTPDQADDGVVQQLKSAFRDGVQVHNLKLGAAAPSLPNLTFMDDENIFHATGEKLVFDRSRTVGNCLDVLAKYPQSQFSQPKLDFSALYELTANSGSPNISGGGNVYERLVNDRKNGPSVVDKLKANLLKTSKQALAPADVLKLAMDASGGDYTKAVLATHNLLKAVAYNGRADITNLTADDLNIVKKLGSLRPNGSPNEADKMGPWYHFFGVLTMGALSGRECTHAAMSSEHFSREEASQKIRQLTSNALSYLQGKDAMSLAISPKDKDKASVDEAAFDIVRAFSGEQQSVLSNTMSGALETTLDGARWGVTKVMDLSQSALQKSWSAGETMANKLDQWGVMEPAGRAIVATEGVARDTVSGIKDMFVTARDYWMGH